MAIWTCVECAITFKRDKSGNRPVRFCGNACYHKWQKRNPNAGQFKAGQEVWNKGITGLRVSPATEFKKGCVSLRWVPVGTERTRLDKKTKKPRVWVKTAEPNIWVLRAVVVWERENGPTPPGMVIHHRDHNSMHDAPANLAALTRAEHIAEHRHELRAAYKAKQEQASMFTEAP
jgi:hypothetical protein